MVPSGWTAGSGIGSIPLERKEKTKGAQSDAHKDRFTDFLLDDEHPLSVILGFEFLRPAIAIDARPVPMGLFEQDLQRGGTRRREEVPALAPE